jgi:hypothetical protein
MEQIPGVLLSAMQIMGISVTFVDISCFQHPLNMGAYNAVTNEMALCVDNAQSNKVSLDRVVRHEMIHAVHQRYRLEYKTLTPEPRFTNEVKKELPSEEVLTVLSVYDRKIAPQELEARLLEKTLSNDEVAALGVASQIFYNTSKP